jgi:hypothetical protein
VSNTWSLDAQQTCKTQTSREVEKVNGYSERDGIVTLCSDPLSVMVYPQDGMRIGSVIAHGVELLAHRGARLLWSPSTDSFAVPMQNWNFGPRDDPKWDAAMRGSVELPIEGTSRVSVPGSVTLAVSISVRHSVFQVATAVLAPDDFPVAFDWETCLRGPTASATGWFVELPRGRTIPPGALPSIGRHPHVARRHLTLPRLADAWLAGLVDEPNFRVTGPDRQVTVRLTEAYGQAHLLCWPPGEAVYVTPELRSGSAMPLLRESSRQIVTATWEISARRLGRRGGARS